MKEIAKTAKDYAKAWSSGNASSVVDFYADDGEIIINRGEPIVGPQALTQMVEGFYSEFPDLVVNLDHLRVAGSHVMFGWTLVGTHSQTKQRVCVPGWEEWDVNDAGKVQRSMGWFDAAEYDRQVQKGI